MGGGALAPAGNYVSVRTFSENRAEALLVFSALRNSAENVFRIIKRRKSFIAKLVKLRLVGLLHSIQNFCCQSPDACEFPTATAWLAVPQINIHTCRFNRRQSGENNGRVAPHFHMLLWGAHIDGDDPFDWVKHYKWQLTQGGLADGKRLIRSEHYLDGVESTVGNIAPDVEVYRSVRKRKKGVKVTVQYWLRDGVAHLTEWAKKLAAQPKRRSLSGICGRSLSG
jgi:hypothetical protein